LKGWRFGASLSFAVREGEIVPPEDAGKSGLRVVPEA